MSNYAESKRKVIGWAQINQNTSVDWAKGEGDASHNKKMILEVTGGEIPLLSIPKDNKDAYNGKNSATRIFPDQLRGAKGGYTAMANPDTIGLFLLALLGTPTTVDNGDNTYTHTFILTNEEAEHYGNLGFLDFQGGVDSRADGLKIANLSIKSAGEDGGVEITFDGIGKGCDLVTGTDKDKASESGIHGFQRWGFSVAKTTASITGLANDSTAYTCTITADGGSPEAVSVVGSAAQTIAELITEINADLSDSYAEWSDDGNGFIRIISNTNGASSSIVIADTDLFGTLTDGSATAETAVDGYAYACISSTNFYWKDCSFSINSSVDSLIRNMEINIKRELTETRNGSKYLAFPKNAGASTAEVSFSRIAEDSTYQQKVIAGTLHNLVWTIASADVIGSGTRNPSLVVSSEKLYIAEMPKSKPVVKLMGIEIKGEAIRECDDASTTKMSFALTNTIPSYLIST